MNLSSQPIVIPTTHQRRRYIPTAKTSMFIDASPIAVSNKIRAIQARKTRLNPISTNTAYTDIRPLNFNNSSKPNVTVWAAEKVVNKNTKDVRLDRISTRQPSRQPVLTSQQTLLWSNCQTTRTTTTTPSTGGNKQLQPQSNLTTITPPTNSSIKNKSAGDKMPEIHRPRNRQPLIDRQNILPQIQSQQISCQIPIINSVQRTNNENNIVIYEDNDEEEEEEEAEEEEDEDDILANKEFEQYLEKATVKCADWLIKYVFNENNNN